MKPGDVLRFGRGLWYRFDDAHVVDPPEATLT